MKKITFRHWILQVGLLSLLVFASCGKDVEQVPAEPADIETRAAAATSYSIPIPNATSFKLQNETVWGNYSPRYISEQMNTVSIDVQMTGSLTRGQLEADFDNTLRLLGNWLGEDLTSWIDLIYLEETTYYIPYSVPGYRYHVEIGGNMTGAAREIQIGALTFVQGPI